MASTDELKTLEKELKERESLLNARQEAIDHQLAEKGKTLDTSSSNPPPPSNYVAFIKPMFRSPSISKNPTMPSGASSFSSSSAATV